jgi:hypothetical protein
VCDQQAGTTLVFFDPLLYPSCRRRRRNRVKAGKLAGTIELMVLHEELEKDQKFRRGPSWLVMPRLFN